MNLKKALKHDVEVAGKTIPTMILVGLFLVGGSSAALLSNFGTVSGEADVTQSIQIDGSNGDLSEGSPDLSFGFSTPTAGSTTVDTFTVKNNMDREYPVEFASYTGESSVLPDSDADETSAQFKWAGSSSKGYGIRTTYANYFADAGADVSSYSVDVEDASDSVAHVGDGDSNHHYSSLSSALDSDSDYDKVYVYSGDYDPVRVDNPVELIGVSEPDGGDAATITVTGSNAKQQSGIYVDSEDVTVKGLEFEVKPTIEEGNYAGLKVASSTDVEDGDVEILSNVFSDETGQEETAFKGINVNGDSDASVNVSGNEFNGLRHAIHVMDGNDVNVEGNTFDGQAENGVFVTNNKGNGLDVEVEDNFFTGIGGFDNSDYPARVDGGAAVHINDEDDNADSTVTVERNRFSESNTADLGAFNVPEGTTLELGENFFAQGTWDAVNNGNIEGDVDASYQTVDSIPANSDVEVAAVNEFALMLDGSSYSLATAIQ